MTYQFIKTETDGNILTIKINREEKMNALNAALLQELKHAVVDGEQSKDVHGIIITGEGSKAFAAGADIAEFSDFTPHEGRDLSTAGHEVMNTVENCSKPVIAAVNGFALGGGCELAMACHMRVASPNAKFGQPEVNLGLIPGYGGTQRLIQLIGKGKALELLTTADMIDAEEAHRLGLVNHVVPLEELHAKCAGIIGKIASKSPQAIAKTLDCALAYFEKDRNGMQVEIDQFGSSFGTADFIEGTTAFLEKRKALYNR